MQTAKQQPFELTLFRGWATTGVFVWSPFVTKVELRLREAGVKYSIASGSLSTAPKGKIPYIDLNTDGQGQSIGDSSLIIKHLIEADIVADVNRDLSPVTRAHDLAIRALLEDKLYFYHVSISSFVPNTALYELTQFRLESDGSTTTTQCVIMFFLRFHILSAFL